MSARKCELCGREETADDRLYEMGAHFDDTDFIDVCAECFKEATGAEP